ncbi:error-prone DNA polymerase [Martelella radicis]|uniref:Error-prone DNA polymerase n=1 Tax=Martelella radicis TaxID=1397476 RepID=A0A7W6KJK6_9HYPH|nr:error-prone DNA polymerase [Martelella radicis]MBB4122519.1 error-prone DNA polymerase [Martelella radicis]
MDYAELCVTSNFTFLTGASHPEEMVVRAAELDLDAIAITDRNSLAGVVRAFRALKETRRKLEKETEEQCIRLAENIDPSSRQSVGGAKTIPLPRIRRLPRLIVGCRLVLSDSPVDFVALPKDKSAYQKLARLLSLGKQRTQKGECLLYLSDMLDWADGSILIALPQEMKKKAEVTGHITQALRRFPGHVFTGAAPRYDGSDAAWFKTLTALSHTTGAPMVAVGDVLMHHASRRQLADVLTCMRHHITIDEIGRLALPNAERRLKPADEMAHIFRDHPAAIRRTLEIAARLTFDLTELSYNYPAEVAHGEAPQARLARLTWEGLKWRNPEGIPARHRELAEKELALVDELGFAAYFLTVHDIIVFARSKGILCQGRGSAANSILCYALRITDVSPDMIGMVFERFVSRHRGEPPDIDVDFEHERREEVIQHIYDKYGRDHAGLCATVIHFRSRAAIREVGKVMGLSNDVTAALSGQIWGISSKGADPERLKEVGLDLSDRRLTQTVRIIGEIIGFPRHLSQHVGGFVITHDRLDELCPIENAAMEDRTVIEWDKDDIDALQILKVDVLSLGMLTCLQKSFDLLSRHYNRPLTIAEVPQGDAATYDMLCAADAVGVFQVESRAQMNFLPRMQPRKFYDLVIEVAIVRPGPIQGGMVQPYIQRRQRKAKIEYPSPELEDVLKKTLGVPLFQEQAMLIAVVAAGFSAEDADRLRRSLASFRQMGTIGEFEAQFVNGMLKNGYERDFAERCFAQIRGFADYGFPESHAAAFAMLTYVSAWLKCHYPAAFACALLNSQPMGFYAPAQIVRDAREHQVEVRPISVNHSAWDCTLERRADGAYALRLGFRQIKGLKQEDATWLEKARGNGYQTPEDVWLRAGLMPAVLERLAEADAFADAGLSRRDALWRVKAIRAPKPLPLFNDPIVGEHILEPDVLLPVMNLGEQVVEDYVATRMSLRAHPMELLRPKMPGLTLHSALATTPQRRVSVSGLVITRQRPGTASGVIFLTLEDETGVSNVVVWNKVYERFRRTVMGGRLLKVTGKLQREGVVVHVIAETIEDCSWRLSELGHPMDDAIGVTDPKADDTPRRPRLQPRAHHPREQAKKLFPSRDFH